MDTPDKDISKADDIALIVEGLDLTTKAVRSLGEQMITMMRVVGKLSADLIALRLEVNILKAVRNDH